METTSDEDLMVCSLDHTASDEQLQVILELSNTIFTNMSGKETTPNRTLEGWRSRLADEHASVAYISRKSDSRILGFFVSYPLIQPEIGFKTMHIWIAGIDERFRGLRLFQRLLDQTKSSARSHGYEYLTVCTFPDWFPQMYRILQKNGWEFVAWREQYDTKKVLMKMRLT